MSLVDQGFVSPRPLNHSRLSAVGPPGETGKTGPWAAARLTRKDEDATGSLSPKWAGKSIPANVA